MDIAHAVGGLELQVLDKHTVFVDDTHVPAGLGHGVSKHGGLARFQKQWPDLLALVQLFNHEILEVFPLCGVHCPLELVTIQRKQVSLRQGRVGVMDGF